MVALAVAVVVANAAATAAAAGMNVGLRNGVGVAPVFTLHNRATTMGHAAPLHQTAWAIIQAR